MLRRAAQIITGPFRTTAGAALDVEDTLASSDATARTNSSRSHHVDQHHTTPRGNDALRKQQQGPEPSRSIFKHPRKEVRYTAQPVREAPTTRRTSMVDPTIPHIAESPEIALKEHDATDPSTLCVYTDGSGIKGHVGAAVVAPMLAIQGIRAKRAPFPISIMDLLSS